MLNKDLNLFLEYMRVIQGANEKLTIVPYGTILKEMVDYVFDGDMDRATFENIAKIRGSEYSIKWLKPLEDRGYKSASINKRIACLSRLYTYMQGELYCVNNTAKTIPRSHGIVKEKRIVTKNEGIELVVYANKHKLDDTSKYLSFRNYLMIALLLSNGFRCAELEYLRIQDIDLDTGKTTIVRWSEEGGVKFSKTRYAFINDKLLEDLNIYINNYRPKSKNGDILFLSKNGRQMTSRDILRTVNKVSESAGLPKINTHALRACHSSTMINSSNDNAEILRRELGHSNINTTLDNYFNTDDKNLKELSNSNPLFSSI